MLRFRFVRYCSFAILATLGAVIVYLSATSSPNLAEQPWIPGFVTYWADRNPNLRTAVPFFLISIPLPFTCRSWPTAVRFDLLFNRAVTVFFLLLGVEIMQLGIETRTFDFADIFFGSIGSLIGLLCGIAIWVFVTGHLDVDGERR